MITYFTYKLNVNFLTAWLYHYVDGAATTQSVLDSRPCGMEWQASTIYPTHYLPAACRIGADVGGGVSTCEDLALATRNTAQGGTRSVKARECGAHESVRSHVLFLSKFKNVFVL